MHQPAALRVQSFVRRPGCPGCCRGTEARKCVCNANAKPWQVMKDQGKDGPKLREVPDFRQGRWGHVGFLTIGESAEYAVFSVDVLQLNLSESPKV